MCITKVAKYTTNEFYYNMSTYEILLQENEENRNVNQKIKVIKDSKILVLYI